MKELFTKSKVIKRTQMLLLLLPLILILTAGTLNAANMATIGGQIFTGEQDINGQPVYGGTPLIGAKVMVQNQHHGGEFITYGTVTGNSWAAKVPVPGDYIVMFTAPGHDTTSREFIVEPGDKVSHDAYLPPLPLPKANLLYYAFYDQVVNGEDDAPDDPPLNGVTVTVRDEDGNILAVGVTGSQEIINTKDGTQIDPADGYYYFTDLPPGEVLVSADSSTVHSAVNPAFNFNSTTEFYLTTSEEGGHAWDPKLYPGDPGTEAGGYLIWHGFVPKLGQIGSSTNNTPPSNPRLLGSIAGALYDADGTAPGEPFPVWLPNVTPNKIVPDGFLILFTDSELVPTHPVATTESDPETGYFKFDNVPAGNYKIYACDKPIDYVWGQVQVKVWPGFEWKTSIARPRFFARAQGYVTVNPTGKPARNARVNMRLKDGSIWKTETTDENGWYNFDDLPEVEVIGYVDVDLPDKTKLRGRIITETLDPDDIDQTNPTIDVTHNTMNRLIQWFTFNYQADLQLERIPDATGDINGFAFYDHFALGSWVGDGIYESAEERTLHGVTVKLYRKVADPETGEVTWPFVDSTTTGVFDEAGTVAQGWTKPYTWPPDEFGGVYRGDLIGFYEFRDLEPGRYRVEAIPPKGYKRSPQKRFHNITVRTGKSRQVNLGLNTRPKAKDPVGVALAGEIEGGVFDDLNIDGNPLSLLFFEKAGITGTAVGVYDHLGYQLGAGYMGNPLCYDGSAVCPPGETPVQKPEMERRFAPGVHIYVGNDPNSPNYNPNYLSLALPYMFGQGQYKFEADWSLVPVAFTFDPGKGAMLGNGPLRADNRPLINNIGPGGSYIITGENFGDEQGYSTVTLSGTRLKVKSWSDTEIHVEDPEDIPSGPVTVATSTGISNAWWFSDGDVYPSRSVYVGPGGQYGTISEALKSLPSEKDDDEKEEDGGKDKDKKKDDDKHSKHDKDDKHDKDSKHDKYDNDDNEVRYIFVGPGTYPERVEINKSNVWIIGAGPHETFIDASLIKKSVATQGFYNGGGPVFTIGYGEDGGVKNVMISGVTITGGSVNQDELGGGIFGDYGNKGIDINNSIIINNGGLYGGGIWLHNSNHDVRIWSNTIAENGNFGGYGGGISVNDEPEYGPDYSEPDHTWDDGFKGDPPGTYEIFNNLIFHNYSADYGGGISLYEVKDRLDIFGNMIIENKADDHGGGAFFEDTGPIELYGNVFLRNYCADDGGALSFEDVGDRRSKVKVYDNLFAENIADDRSENHARGGAISFDDTLHAKVYRNTIVGNIVAGRYFPVGGAIDSERHGHEYEHVEPGFSDPEITDNIIWKNWRLYYAQPDLTGEDDLEYVWGENFIWSLDQLHVDNPELQSDVDSHKNSESFSEVEDNIISGGEYSGRDGNREIDPLFINPKGFDWNLSPNSPLLDDEDDDDDGDEESKYPGFPRVPTGITGAVWVPNPGVD